VQADLERRQLGEQFRVLEAAFPPTEPSAPNRQLLLVIGAMAGLAIGGGVGILLEGADSSIHGARELQTGLGVPVLASIPAILLESDRAVLARRRWLLGAAAAVITVVCLAGGAATYYVVNGGGRPEAGGAQDGSPRGAGLLAPDAVARG